MPYPLNFPSGSLHIYNLRTIFRNGGWPAKIAVGPTHERCGSLFYEGVGRSPGVGNDSLLQCSCLENPMDRGAWWAAAQGGSKSWTRLSNRARTHIQEDPGALLNDHCLPPVHEGQLLAQLFCQ